MEIEKTKPERKRKSKTQNMGYETNSRTVGYKDQENGKAGIIKNPNSRTAV